MLYSLHDLLIDYFTVRRLAWRGDKEALRWWREHEPELLERWLTVCRATEIRMKVTGWLDLIPDIYAPLGGMAAPDADLIQPTEESWSRSGGSGEAVEFWQALTDR